MMSLMIMESGVTFKELEKKIYAWICQIGERVYERVPGEV